MMGELANCMNCNEVFVKTVRDICQKCYEAEEEAFEIVYRFLTKRKNRQATIMEIVEATGVEEDLIIKFVKEKRLRAADFPNLNYPCEKCGQPITTGRICEQCSSEMIKELKFQEEIEQQINQRKKAERDRENVYYSFKTKSRD
mgnify:FL=1